MYLICFVILHGLKLKSISGPSPKGNGIEQLLAEASAGASSCARGPGRGFDAQKVAVLGESRPRGAEARRGPHDDAHTWDGGPYGGERVKAEGDGAGDTGAGVDEPAASPGRERQGT